MDTKGPEKKKRLLAALDMGMVMVHLDARRPGVLVPTQLRSESHLRLNISYNFDPPDLSVGEWGVRCTLSFSGSRFLVAVPWSALFAVTSHATKEFWLYPDDIPPELVENSVAAAKAQQQAGPPAEEGTPRAVLREVVLDAQEQPQELASSPSSSSPEDPPKPRGRGHLRVVK